MDDLATGAPIEPRGIPEEVRRLRLDAGDRLIVRVRDTWAMPQVRQYQEWLEARFPDNEVLVIVGEEIAVESAASEPQWVTAEVGSTAMSDEDVNRIVEKICKRLPLPPAGGVRVMSR